MVNGVETEFRSSSHNNRTGKKGPIIKKDDFVDDGFVATDDHNDSPLHFLGLDNPGPRNLIVGEESVETFFEFRARIVDTCASKTNPPPVAEREKHYSILYKRNIGDKAWTVVPKGFDEENGPTWVLPR